MTESNLGYTGSLEDAMLETQPVNIMRQALAKLARHVTEVSKFEAACETALRETPNSVDAQMAYYWINRYYGELENASGAQVSSQPWNDAMGRAAYCFEFARRYARNWLNAQSVPPAIAELNAQA